DERSIAPLNEFEFRQTGNRIEIVDADGSVYAGEIESSEKKDRGAALSAPRDQVASARAPATGAKPAAPKTKNAPVGAEFNFRAAGTNNTLQQKVTIEGVYQAQAEADGQSGPASVATGGAVKQEELKSARPAQQMQQSQSPSRARVVGRAQINGRDVEVNAEATK